jgi:hypothetical protein
MQSGVFGVCHTDNFNFTIANNAIGYREYVARFYFVVPFSTVISKSWAKICNAVFFCPNYALQQRLRKGIEIVDPIVNPPLLGSDGLFYAIVVPVYKRAILFIENHVLFLRDSSRGLASCFRLKSLLMHLAETNINQSN